MKAGDLYRPENGRQGMENNLTKEIKIPCPICNRRICDGKGLPEGVFEIELKCKTCGYVWLDAQYLRKFLDIPDND